MVEISKREIILGGLNCAHCSEVINDKVSKLEEIKSCNLNFINKKLTVEIIKSYNEDLVIEKNINGKKILDNSNLTEMENSYVQQESLNVFDNLVNKFCGMSIAELIMDIGILDEKQSEEFGNKLINAFTNVPLDELNTP